MDSVVQGFAVTKVRVLGGSQYNFFIGMFIWLTTKSFNAPTSIRLRTLITC